MATTTRTRRKAKAAKPAAKRKAAARKPARKAAAAQATKQEWRPPAGPGTFCWHELVTANLPASKAFYGALFGWTTREEPMGNGSTTPMWQRGADSIGCAATSYPGISSAWLSYVLVTDVDGTASKCASLGGTVVVPPTDISGGHGRYAILRDPQGAPFALYAMPKTA